MFQLNYHFFVVVLVLYLNIYIIFMRDYVDNKGGFNIVVVVVVVVSLSLF